MNQTKKLRAQKYQIIKNFTLIDIGFFVVFVGLSAIIGFLGGASLKLTYRIAITIICMIPFLFTFINMSKHNCRAYFLVFKLINHAFMKRRFKANETQALVPFYKIEDGQIVYLNKNKGLKENCISVLKIRGYVVFNNNRQDIEAIFTQLTNIFNNINCKISLVKIPSTIEVKDNLELLKNKQIDQNDELKVNYHEELLLDFETLSEMKIFDSYYIVVNGNDKKILKDNINSLAELINNTQLKATIIKDVELIKFLNYLYENNLNEDELVKYLAYQKSGLKNEKRDKEHRKLYEILAPESIEFKPTYMKVNDNYLSFQALNDFNTFQLQEGWAYELFNTDSIIVWNLWPLSESGKQSIVDKSGKVLESNADTKSLFKSRKSEVEIQALLELNDLLASEKTNVFDSNIIFINKAKSLKELCEKEKINNKTYLYSSANVNPCLLNQRQAFLNSLFLNNDYLNNNLEMPANNVVRGWMWINNFLNDGNDFLFGYSNMTASPIIFDPFIKDTLRTSFSTIFWGVPGSGKSAAASKLVLNQYMAGNEIIFIDPQREYRDLCLKLKGNWIELGQGLNTSINPLQIDLQFDNSLKDNHKIMPNEQLIRHNVKKASSFFKMLYPNWNNDQIRFISKMINKLYLDNDFDTKDITKLKNSDYPIISDLIKVIRNYQFDSEISQKMQENIKNYILTILEDDFENNGIYQALYNNITTIDFNSDFTIIDTYNITMSKNDNESHAAMFLLLSFIQNKVSLNFFKNKDKKVVIAFDEVHQFVSPDNLICLKFIFNMIKTARKYRTSVFLITQNPSDFEQSEDTWNLTRSMVENIQYTLILRQSNNGVDAIEKMYAKSNPITQSEKLFLMTAPIGQGIFTIDSNNRMNINVYYNDLEKELIFKSGDLSI